MSFKGPGGVSILDANQPSLDRPHTLADSSVARRSGSSGAGRERSGVATGSSRSRASEDVPPAPPPHSTGSVLTIAQFKQLLPTITTPEHGRAHVLPGGLEVERFVRLLQDFPASFTRWTSTGWNVQLQDDPAFDGEKLGWGDWAITVERGDGSLNNPYILVCPAYRVPVGVRDPKHWDFVMVDSPRRLPMSTRPGPDCFKRYDVLSYSTNALKFMSGEKSANPGQQKFHEVKQRPSVLNSKAQHCPPASLMRMAIPSGCTLAALRFPDEKQPDRVDSVVWHFHFAGDAEVVDVHFQVSFSLRRRNELDHPNFPGPPLSYLSSPHHPPHAYAPPPPHTDHHPQHSAHRRAPRHPQAGSTLVPDRYLSPSMGGGPPRRLNELGQLTPRARGNARVETRKKGMDAGRMARAY